MDIDTDSPSASLKRLLEAKAVRDAKHASSKKTKSSSDSIDNPSTHGQTDNNDMDIEDNIDNNHNTKNSRTAEIDAAAGQKERSRKTSAGGLVEQRTPRTEALGTTEATKSTGQQAHSSIGSHGRRDERHQNERQEEASLGAKD